jgi:hypothetical protein
LCSEGPPLVRIPHRFLDIQIRGAEHTLDHVGPLANQQARDGADVPVRYTSSERDGALAEIVWYATDAAAARAAR